MKTYLITSYAEKINKKGDTKAFRMAIHANGKVEAKKMFRTMTGYTGKIFAEKF